jgi:hypothetical protein
MNLLFRPKSFRTNLKSAIADKIASENWILYLSDSWSNSFLYYQYYIKAKNSIYEHDQSFSGHKKMGFCCHGKDTKTNISGLVTDAFVRKLRPKTVSSNRLQRDGETVSGNLSELAGRERARRRPDDSRRPADLAPRDLRTLKKNFQRPVFLFTLYTLLFLHPWRFTHLPTSS